MGAESNPNCLVQECFSSDICVFVWPDFDLTDYWILISNLEAQPLQLGELGRIGSKNIVLCKVFVKGQVGNC